MSRWRNCGKEVTSPPPMSVRQAPLRRAADPGRLDAQASVAPTGGSTGRRAGGDVLVLAGTSTTVHRSDCALPEGRDDLTPAGPGGHGLTACRLCNPTG